MSTDRSRAKTLQPKIVDEPLLGQARRALMDDIIILDVNITNHNIKLIALKIPESHGFIGILEIPHNNVSIFLMVDASQLLFRNVKQLTQLARHTTFIL